MYSSFLVYCSFGLQMRFVEQEDGPKANFLQLFVVISRFPEQLKKRCAGCQASGVWLKVR